MLIKAILTNKSEDVFTLLRYLGISLKGKKSAIANKTLIIETENKDIILNKSFSHNFCDLLEISIKSYALDISYTEESFEQIKNKDLNKMFRHTYYRPEDLLKSGNEEAVSKFKSISYIKDKIEEKFGKEALIYDDSKFQTIDIIDFVKIAVSSILLKINKDYYLNIPDSDLNKYKKLISLNSIDDINQVAAFVKSLLIQNDLSSNLKISEDVFNSVYNKRPEENLLNKIKETIEISNIKKTNQEDIKNSNKLNSKVKELQYDPFNYNSSSEEKDRTLIIQVSLNNTNPFKLRDFYSSDKSSKPFYHTLKIDHIADKGKANEYINKQLNDFNKTKIVDFVIELESVDRIKDMDAINYLIKKGFIKNFHSIDYGYLNIPPDDTTIRISFWNRKNKNLLSLLNGDIMKHKKIFVAIKRWF